jgi:hypothetical protein
MQRNNSKEFVTHFELALSRVRHKTGQISPTTAQSISPNDEPAGLID